MCPDDMIVRFLKDELVSVTVKKTPYYVFISIKTCAREVFNTYTMAGAPDDRIDHFQHFYSLFLL